MTIDGSPRSQAEAEERRAYAVSLIRYEAELLARIRRMMGAEVREVTESGDVLQTVYADALRGLQLGTLVGMKLLPWMTEVARHRIVDEVRRHRKQRLSPSLYEPPSHEASSAARSLDHEEVQRALESALARLEPARRRVVALRCLEGWPWQRVALALGRSEEAVRKLYDRALDELAGSLESHDPFPDGT